jgi:hypothetical protein
LANASTVLTYAWVATKVLDGSTNLAYRFGFTWINNGVSLYAKAGGAEPATTFAGALNGNQWYHFAAIRSGSKMSVYVNGVFAASSVSISGAINDSPVDLLIGGMLYSSGADECLNGWIDELRITKGLARYPSETSFTPPAAAFPDP